MSNNKICFSNRTYESFPLLQVYFFISNKKVFFKHNNSIDIRKKKKKKPRTDEKHTRFDEALASYCLLRLKGESCWGWSMEGGRRNCSSIKTQEWEIYIDCSCALSRPARWKDDAAGGGRALRIISYPPSTYYSVGIYSDDYV